jgi:hypothetical protein
MRWAKKSASRDKIRKWKTGLRSRSPPGLEIIYPQSEFPQSKVLCGESEQWEYITILTGSFSLTIPYTLNIYAWDDQLVIHIHHVIVRQYKVAQNRYLLSICGFATEKEGRRWNFLGNTHLPSAATLPDLASPHSTFGWKLFIPNLNSLSQRYCAGKASSENILPLAVKSHLDPSLVLHPPFFLALASERLELDWYMQLPLVYIFQTLI